MKMMNYYHIQKRQENMSFYKNMEGSIMNKKLHENMKGYEVVDWKLQRIKSQDEIRGEMIIERIDDIIRRLEECQN